MTGAHKKGLYQKRFGHLSEQVGKLIITDFCTMQESVIILYG